MNNNNGTNENEKKEKRLRTVSDAVSRLDDSLLEEYMNRKKKSGASMKTKIIALCASLAIIISAIPLTAFFLQSGDGGFSFFPEKGNENFSILSVRATASDADVPELIDKKSAFTVSTENGTKEFVEKHLYLSPPINYTVSQTGDEEFTVTPVKELSDNTVISLSYVEDGAVADSWAFQTSSRFSVSGTYPGNGEMGVSVNSVIEFEFSYADAREVDSMCEFSPSIDGSWEHMGRIWRFTPAAPLEKDTVYSLTVGAEVSSGDMTLGEAYTLSFGTFEYLDSVNPDLLSDDGINTYLPDEVIHIRASCRSEIANAQVKLGRFEGKDSLMSYLAGDHRFDLSAMDSVPFFGEFEKESYTMALDCTLDEGYYLAKVFSGENFLFDWLIQINSTSAYSAMTGKDIIVWANSPRGNDVPVFFGGEEYRCDEDGLLIISDSTKKGDYLYIGEGENPLIVGVRAFGSETYPNAYIYTDRPIYKPTDTVKIWGFVPLDLIESKDKWDFSLSLYNWSGTAQAKESKLTVTPDEDGIFTAEIELSSHYPTYTTLFLNCNGEHIASRGVQIEEYSEPYYTYELIAERNFAFIGESYDFDVKVTHITGFSVPEKKIKVRIDNSTYTALTDENGIAHFSVPMKESAGIADTYGSFEYLQIGASDGDSNTKEQYLGTVCMFTSRCDAVLSNDGFDFSAELSTLDADSVNTEKDCESLTRNPYEAYVRVMLTERKTTRFISHYDYDEISKENVPVYGEANESSILCEYTQFSKDGKVNVRFDPWYFANETEDASASYSVSIAFTDENGKGITRTIYIGNPHRDGISDKSKLHSHITYTLNGRRHDHYLNQNRNSYKYYAYAFTELSGKKAVGETLKTKVVDINDRAAAGGKVLMFTCANGIFGAKLYSGTGEFTVDFTEANLPHSYLSGAYLKDGKFSRIMPQRISADAEDRKLNIEITPDKKEYKPGDEVSLDILVTDKDNAPRSASLCVSVVNEAVFRLYNDDSTPISSTVFANVDYPLYTFSTYRDFGLLPSERGMGGGSGPRYDFGDTAYFAQLKSDENGKAHVSFTLPDNITEYRITVHGARRDLLVGVNRENISASMDFFIESEPPIGVKSVDDLVLSAVCAGGEVQDAEYTFTIAETGEAKTLRGKTNSRVWVNFGKTEPGEYTAEIRVKGKTFSDSVSYKVKICENSRVTTKTEVCDISDSSVKLTSVRNPAILEVMTEDTEKCIELCKFLTGNTGNRLDCNIGSVFGSRTLSRICNEGTVTSFKKDAPSKDGLLQMNKSSDPDMVLTALCMYFVSDEMSLPHMEIPHVTNELIPYLEATLCRSAMGEAVILDLIRAKEALTSDTSISGEDKSYGYALISLSYMMLGDYRSGREAYSLIDKESENTVPGFDSLCALAAVYFDKGNADGMLHKLTSEKHAEEYLAFAVMARINSLSGEYEKSITVKHGDTEEKITVSNLEKKTVSITAGENEKITLCDGDEGICVRTVTAVYGLSEDFSERDIKISLPEKIKSEGITYLTVDMGDLEKNGVLSVVIPPSLKLASGAKLPRGITSASSGERGEILLYVGENAPGKFKIPLEILLPGEYTFEELVYTRENKTHISDRQIFTISEN